MPRYDYECSRCGQITEADREVARRGAAPACVASGAPTVLLVGVPLVVFRGAGWSASTTQERLARRSREHTAREHGGSPIGPSALRTREPRRRPTDVR
jgi:putative FmdB family regulatory protein